MLKFWAVVFMTLDHMGYYLQPFLPAEVYLLTARHRAPGLPHIRL